MTESAPPAAVVLRFAPDIDTDLRERLTDALQSSGLTVGIGLDVGHRATTRAERFTAAVLTVTEQFSGGWADAARTARGWLRSSPIESSGAVQVELQRRVDGTVIKVNADDPDDALMLLDRVLETAGSASFAWDGTAWREDQQPDEASAVSEPGRFDRTRTVFVAHGRDKRLRAGIFAFLRALGLHPIEWAEALAGTGHGAPYIGDVLSKIMFSGQAVLVLLTPDEIAYLRPEHADHERDAAVEPAGQARPNVIFEAGMALAMFPEQTILVRIGDVRTFTDLDGRYISQLDDSSEKRHLLAERLRSVGCAVDTGGKDWMRAGDLTPPAPYRAPAPSEQAPADASGPTEDDTSDELKLSNYAVVNGALGLVVHGEATNLTGRELSAVLRATFFDEKHRILGTASGFVNQLKAHSTKSFSLMTADEVPAYATFSVQVDTVM
ncbi:TIR domain-containing protein [Kribbella lupini]|uniref:CD-NTase-associated protein 12/Pycsar effector protein TIR domain-containing protein n=1 Tax=Kribbella lupini TaxID=291602 RepID=A0ABN2CMS7_9ACTN